MTRGNLCEIIEERFKIKFEAWGEYGQSKKNTSRWLFLMIFAERLFQMIFPPESLRTSSPS